MLSTAAERIDGQIQAESSKFDRSRDLSCPRARVRRRNPKSSISRNKSTLFSGATERTREGRKEREREGEGERERSGFPENKTNRRPRTRTAAAEAAAIIIKLKREIYPESGEEGAEEWQREIFRRAGSDCSS